MLDRCLTPRLQIVAGFVAAESQQGEQRAQKRERPALESAALTAATTAVEEDAWHETHEMVHDRLWCSRAGEL